MLLMYTLYYTYAAYRLYLYIYIYTSDVNDAKIMQSQSSYLKSQLGSGSFY